MTGQCIRCGAQIHVIVNHRKVGKQWAQVDPQRSKGMYCWEIIGGDLHEPRPEGL